MISKGIAIPYKLTHFMPMVFFYTPLKHQKTSIKKILWHEMGYNTLYSKNSENVSLSYLAYLQTHINYGLTLWRRTTNNNLKFMQNKVKIAIRIICFKSSNHSTVSMFHEHQILTLKRLRGSIRSRHPRAVLTKIYLLERRWILILS